MTRTLKIASLVLLGLVLVVGALVLWRVLARPGRTPEGFAILTPVPGAPGFEPRDLPSGPVLRNQSPGALAVDFGYAVGGVPYSYSLALDIPAGAATGRARLAVRHEGRTASTDSAATRRWDAPRKAFALALSDKFMSAPPVPGLCLKAVLGPDLARYDLAEATICVARRDVDGGCHPETLACGRIRN